MASKRPLWILAAACLAPFVASTALYYWWTPAGGQVNYGTLITPTPIPLTAIQPIAGSPVPEQVASGRGNWRLLVVDAAACAQRCQDKLYATRQARTMTGKERDRVDRLWLIVGDGAPSPALLAQHPDLIVARPGPELTAALPADASDTIHIVDPPGNLILRYPASPDIRALYKDLARLLLASPRRT